MFKKYLTLILAIMLVNLSFGVPAFAETTKEKKEAKFAEKMKTNVAKLGTGKDAKVKVKLKDGTMLKGYVSQINETGFVVTDENTGASSEVPYPNAKQIKGNNLSTGAAIAIGFGIALLLIFILTSG